MDKSSISESPAVPPVVTTSSPPVLSETPSGALEEEAKKEAANQATKFNEKISKVKGKVVVSSNALQVKPTPSLLKSKQPDDHSITPNKSSLTTPTNTSSVNIPDPSGTSGAASSITSPVTSAISDSHLSVSSATHQKQPSVHAHFLYEDVVHAGTRSRSGSCSRDRTVGVSPPRSAPRIDKDKALDGKSLHDALSNIQSNSSIQSPGSQPFRAGHPDATSPNPPESSGVSLSKSAAVTDGKSGPQSAPVTEKASPPALVNTSNTAGDPRLPQDDGKLHILLAATGSVSTSKLRLIIHKLDEIYGKDRASIQIILTKASENFISRGEIPSHIRIWRDKDEWETWHGRSDPVIHIELRRWADILVIAPLSANTLGKIALGLCDNLLTCVVRAWNTQYPILIAPAMVSAAYNHPATKAHLKVIKEEMKWIEVLKPVEKVVGSYGDIGLGGMMDWNEIVNKIVLKLGGYPEEDDNDDDNDDGNDDNNDDDDDDDEDDDDDDDDGEDEAKSKRGPKYKNNEEDEEELDSVVKKLSLADLDHLEEVKGKLLASKSRTFM